MARPLRQDGPGMWHHVVNRGARREFVFEPEEHAGLFRSQLAAAVDNYKVEVHAYALMGNHYHLLIRSVQGNLSDAMQFLGSRFTQELNAIYGWDGPVFGKRFWNQALHDEQAILTVAAYIHLNPIRGGIVRRLDQHCWTSHRAYLGLDVRPDWLTTKTLTDWAGGPAAFAERVYDLRRNREGWPEGFDENAGVFATVAASRSQLHDSDSPEGPEPASAADSVFARVAQLTDTPPDQLNSATAGRHGNAARRFAVWALRRDTLLRDREIGAMLGMTKNQVAVTMHRLKKRPGAQIVSWQEKWDAE